MGRIIKPPKIVHVTLSGPSEFDYSSVGNLYADFDARHGITTETGVSSWVSQVDSNHDAVQAVTSKQPAYNAADADFNGRPSLGFNGSTNSRFLKTGLNFTGLASKDRFAVYIVGQITSGMFWEIADDASGNSVTNQFVSGTTMFSRRKLGGSNRDKTETSISTPQTGIWGCTWLNAAGNEQLWRNGVDVSSSASTYDANSFVAGANNMFIGIFANSSTLPLDGKIARILVYNGDIGAAGNTTVLNNLNADYQMY